MGDVCVWELDADASSAASRDPASRWNSPDFTSWGYTKTHHYCGGIYCLAFAPDGQSLIGCGMGPMRDPMAGNGKMTWQRWDWTSGKKLDEIKEGEHGAGPMEALAWRPDGAYFLMAGRQAQGTWNAAMFSADDGNLVHSLDTKNRITQAAFTADGASLVIAAATGQPARNDGKWDPWGRLQVYGVSD
jgi:WD40 repeat protein